MSRILRPGNDLWLPGQPMPKLSPGWHPCPECCGDDPPPPPHCDDCSVCDGATAPCCLQVDLEGMIDNVCSDCTNLNGRYLLAGPRWVEDYPIPPITYPGESADGCLWRNCLTPTASDDPYYFGYYSGACGYDRLDVFLTCSGFPAYDCWIYVTLWSTTTDDYIVLRKQVRDLVTEPFPDCSSWLALEVSELLYQTGSGAACWATDTVTKVYITALDERNCTSGCGCPCDNCEHGLAPQCVEATIAGVVSDDCDCDCSVLDDTYTVSREAACVLLGSLCKPNHPVTECGFRDLRLEIDKSLGRYEVEATASVTGGAYLKWKKTYTSIPDCENWKDEVIPFHSQSGDVCDGRGSSISLSTVPGIGCTEECDQTDCQEPCITCGDCNADIPPFVKVTFQAGFPNTCPEPSQVDCDYYYNNSPFYLALETYGASNECRWTLALPTQECLSGTRRRISSLVVYKQTVGGSPGIALGVSVSYSGPGGGVTGTEYWAENLPASEYDGCAWSALELTFQHASTIAPCNLLFAGAKPIVEPVWP